MKTRRPSEQPIAENPHGVDVRRLYDSDHAVVSHLTLKPGEKLHRHITPVDVFFYVLEGSGTVEVGDEKVEVGRDTLVESPRDIPHCWYNTGGGPLRVLIVKVPKPSSSTRLL
ncbi:MAG: cupin domain-containing protein [Candidatus Fermentibacteraceae bacterium]|nr:cupin domain-containing protein [Candidatus Fermentibacteraceae bacterium]MBN2608072.1 cupin domain-containing protein [Candidatus Fermentibacteraceae bacterium]